MEVTKLQEQTRAQAASSTQLTICFVALIVFMFLFCGRSEPLLVYVSYFGMAGLMGVKATIERAQCRAFTRNEQVGGNKDIKRLTSAHHWVSKMMWPFGMLAYGCTVEKYDSIHRLSVWIPGR